MGESVPVGAGPVALAADDTGLWVLSADAALVTHLDATSGVTLATPIALPSRPTAIATGAGQVWVASADGTVTRIEPATHRVTATVDVGGSLSAVVASAHAVWVADRSGSVVVRIDPANSAAAGRRITTASEPEALGLFGGEVWVAARSSPTTHRGGTLRVVSLMLPDIGPTGFFELTQLQADGLVAYRRVGGAAGTLLVPDLAVAVPKPTNGGRNYAFQLRPSLEYSTGEPVEASHFRRAIERGFQDAAGFLGAVGGDYFSAIVGADACITPDRSPVARCDLSAGITTDDSANTITFELSRPDPDFLYSLASPLAYPVADGVAMDGPVEGTFPGTGPYVVASHSHTEVRLARNPNFTPWHPDARSGGFVDEIVWTAVDDPDTAVEMVERGDADFTRLSLENRVSPEVLARLRSATDAELHFASDSVTSVTMNTTLAPFDSLAARQAVNMAIDRALIADRRGGPLSAAVTCQVVPPGWSGYQPYCPYTTHPDPGGRWQAPDLEAARRLVDQSGTRGARVIVGPTLSFFSDTRDYLVTLLQELGYDASADTNIDSEYVFKAHFEDNRVQIGVWDWFAGKLTAGDFLRGFTCGIATGTTNFCDPAFEALVAEADTLQLNDPAAAIEKWAAADRMIVDLGVWAPLYNEGSDLISTRVSNYQFHSLYGALLDQMWVQ